MALKATIFRAQLAIADMDRHYYQDHNLTIARHPSETDERMMVRIVCFGIYAQEGLEFTKGISTDSEPDLWQKSLSGEIEHWIDLGQPDEKRIRIACGRAKRVTVVCYSGNSAATWFKKLKPTLTRFKNLQIVNIDNKDSQELAGLAERKMTLQVAIDDRLLSISDEHKILTISPVRWYPETH
ncbi:MAG: YaeQ family protein [Lysobacterales bacterium]